MKKIFSLFVLMLVVLGASAEKVRLYATFGTPGAGASYNSSTNTYTWTADNETNLMNCFTFNNGQLAHYSTFSFTFSDNNEGGVRINLLFSDGTSKDTNSGYYTAGTKNLTLSDLDLTVGETGHTLADVTAIRFGGKYRGSGKSSQSTVVDATEMYLERDKKEATTFNATFGTPANSAKYGNLYEWRATTNNLMSCFTFSSGELANYSTLKFKFSNISGGSVRINFIFSDGKNKNIGSYYSDGEKSVTLSGLNLTVDEVSHTLADVTKINFGGNSFGEGHTKDNTIVYASDMYLIPTSGGENLYATFGSPASSATYTENSYDWSASTNNLMDIFTFGNGELANYTNLTFTFSDLAASSKVRMLYFVGNSSTYLKQNLDAAGTYTINLLDECAVDYATITKMQFGGQSNSGRCVISPSNVTLSNQALVDALERQFTIGRKSTVCLPFGLTEAEASAAGKFYELNSVNGTTLSFTEVTTPAAYTPYVFVPASSLPFAELTKTVASTATKSSTINKTVGGYTFHGVLASGKVPSGAYGYNAENGEFSVTTTGNVTIDAFRAYITVSGGGSARSLRAVFDDEITEINEVKTQKKVEDGVMYNLSGQRVDASYKGIVVMNGRKYYKE